MKFQLALAALVLLLPAQALAQCAITEPLLAHAYPNGQQSDNGVLVKGGGRTIQPRDVVCKAWPWRTELMLAAVPLIETKSATADETKGDVEILVTDPDGKPLARRLERGMAFSDAIQFGEMSLDTARYDVREGLRAFGLRTAQYGSSRVNPYMERSLWLYTFDKGRIERVLDGLIVERSNGENNGACEGEITTVKRTIGLGRKGKQGYRDLNVEQTATHETSKMVGDECLTDERPGKTAKIDLTFDKGRYHPSTGTKPRSGDIEKDLFSLIEIEGR